MIISRGKSVKEVKVSVKQPPSLKGYGVRALRFLSLYSLAFYGCFGGLEVYLI